MCSGSMVFQRPPRNRHGESQQAFVVGVIFLRDGFDLGAKPRNVILRFAEGLLALMAEPEACILLIIQLLLGQICELPSLGEVGGKPLVCELWPDVALLEFFNLGAEMTLPDLHDSRLQQ